MEAIAVWVVRTSNTDGIKKIVNKLGDFLRVFQAPSGRQVGSKRISEVTPSPVGVTGAICELADIEKSIVQFDSK